MYNRYERSMREQSIDLGRVSRVKRPIEDERLRADLTNLLCWVMRMSSLSV